MARTRLWSAFIIGLVEVGSFACTKSEPPALTAREPLVLDASGETLSLDETKVPVVASCANGQIVQKTGTGWACATPGPGGVPVTWETVTDKPESFPPAAHTHAFSEVTGVPDFALSNDVGAVTGRVSAAEGALTTAQGRLTQVEERVGALEAGGGASTLVMSLNPEDSALLGAGYSMVGLGRIESYTARTSVPMQVSHVIGAAVLGTKVHAAGGRMAGSNSCTSNLWEYDLVTDKWRTRQQMSVARWAHVVVGAHSKVYAIGGWSCSASAGTKATEIYDPQLNAWTMGAPLPDHDHHGAAFGILSDGKLHVAGGFDHASNAVSRSHVVYDFDTNAWGMARDLPVPRYSSASGVLPDGRLIIAGGHDGSNIRRETYIFDPATDSWTQVASMPSDLHAHSGAVIAGRFHTFMGYDSAVRNHHYIYDPASDTWSIGAATPISNHTLAVAQLRGGALLIGGWTSGPITAVYEYLAPLYLYSK